MINFNDIGVYCYFFVVILILIFIFNQLIIYTNYRKKVKHEDNEYNFNEKDAFKRYKNIGNKTDKADKNYTEWKGNVLKTLGDNENF